MPRYQATYRSPAEPDRWATRTVAGASLTAAAARAAWLIPTVAGDEAWPPADTELIVLVLVPEDVAPPGGHPTVAGRPDTAPEHPRLARARAVAAMLADDAHHAALLVRAAFVVRLPG